MMSDDQPRSSHASSPILALHVLLDVLAPDQRNAVEQFLAMAQEEDPAWGGAAMAALALALIVEQKANVTSEIAEMQELLGRSQEVISAQIAEINANILRLAAERKRQPDPPPRYEPKIRIEPTSMTRLIAMAMIGAIMVGALTVYTYHIGFVTNVHRAVCLGTRTFELELLAEARHEGHVEATHFLSRGWKPIECK